MGTESQEKTGWILSPFPFWVICLLTKLGGGVHLLNARQPYGTFCLFTEQFTSPVFTELPEQIAGPRHGVGRGHSKGKGPEVGPPPQKHLREKSVPWVWSMVR